MNVKQLFRMMGLFKPHKRALLIVIIGTIMMSMAEVIYPLIAKFILEEFGNQQFDQAKRSLIAIIIVIIALMIIESIGMWIQHVSCSVMMDEINNEMKYKLFSHYNKMSFKYYDNNKVGELMSIIDSDTGVVDKVLWNIPTSLLQSLTTITMAIFVFSAMNIKLLLIMVPSLIGLIIFNYLFPIKVMFPRNKAIRKCGRELMGYTEDRLNGIRTVISFNKQTEENRFFWNQLQNLLSVSKKKWVAIFGHQCITNLLRVNVWLSIIGIGGYWYLEGSISISDIVLFLLNSYLLENPVMQMSHMMRDIAEGLASYNKIEEILMIEPEIKNSPNPMRMDKFNGKITFDDVSFCYNTDNGQNILNNLNLDIKEGEYVALVGPSGCGKSTIANLIPRFYDIKNGTITIDGTNIKDIDLGCLRRSIGIVEQDIYLFHGTVYDNIAYGIKDASMKDVIRVAKQADAHEFISKLPNGYNSDIGEKGVKLSGGQKQRIAIARLFLSNPSILIFDEATSALDEKSQRAVQKSFEKLSKDKTTIVIAHRLSTIKNADRIIYIGKTGIEETGTHKELLKKNGKYARLYDTCK